MWEFPSQGLNPSHSSNLCRSCSNARFFNPQCQGSNLRQCKDNAGSLTHCVTAGTSKHSFFYTPGNRKIHVTCFIVILALLGWSGIKPRIILRSACIFLSPGCLLSKWELFSSCCIDCLQTWHFVRCQGCCSEQNMQGPWAQGAVNRQGN